MNRYKITKKFLMFWCLFVGLGALYGSIMMFINPTGKLLKIDTVLPYFKVLPFSNILFKNYIFSGISLLIVNGISNIIAFYYLLKNKKIGIILGTIFGFTLMLWIIIQFIILPRNILSISFFIIGFIQLITGYMTYVFYCQENFNIDENDYKINKNSNTLVVYFSRMGYTKKIAYEIANNKYDILELTTKEKTDNTTGFLWCGRYNMLKEYMPIDDIKVNLSKYQKIIIVSPIWVFQISSPIKTFLLKYKNDIKDCSYVITHFMKYDLRNIKNDFNKLLEKDNQELTSICIRLGKVKYRKKIN